jgi:hypothetical protein
MSLITLPLQVFLFAMQQILQSKTPLMHEVIPIFDTVTQVLDEHIADAKATLPPAIHVAAARGCAMLDKYYGLTDSSIIYRIAMSKSPYVYVIMALTYLSYFAVLHPGYKMSYFHKVGWPCKWISTAEDALCEEWVLNYKPDILTTNTKTTVSNVFANKRTDYISCIGIFITEQVL